MRSIFTTAIFSAVVIAIGCDTQQPSPEKDTGGEMVGVKVIDAVKTLAGRAKKTVVIDPLAQPICECARTTVLPAEGAEAATVLRDLSKSLEGIGLEVDESETAITIKYGYSRYLPAGCEGAAPARASRSRIRPAPPERPGSLKDRLDPSRPLPGESDDSREPEPPARSRWPDYSRWISKIDNNSYRVSRSIFDEALGDEWATELMRQARVVPSYRDGEPSGFKIFAIRPGSIYHQLGLRNGDTVETANGQRIDAPEKALEVYSSLKAAKKVKLRITRRGSPLELEYRITRK